MTFFSDPSWGPLVSFILLSFLVSLAITVVYRFTTNQRLMREMRHDIKKYQEQARASKDPQKQMQIQKKMMDVNMKYMMQSMRPTFFTLIPVLIVFGWVASHLTVQQIMPGEQFNVTVTLERGNASAIKISVPEGVQVASQNAAGKSANYTITAPEGRHLILFELGDEVVERPILVTTRWDFERPIIKKSGFIDGLFSGELFDNNKLSSDSSFKSISVHHKPVRPFGASFSIPWFSGPYHPGWLFTYIILSLIFSIIIRKFMNVQ